MTINKLKIDFLLGKNLKQAFIPKKKIIKTWLDLAWLNIDFSKSLVHEIPIDLVKTNSLSIFYCDIKTMQKLNLTYRKINKPTNILSFTQIDFTGLKKTPKKKQSDKLFKHKANLLGDLVFCPEIINTQAIEKYKKNKIEHWAHLMVHGLLHLSGFEHQKKKNTRLMEAEEIIILAKLGFDNPYLY